MAKSQRNAAGFIFCLTLVSFGVTFGDLAPAQTTYDEGASIAILSSSDSSFGDYYAEILLTEGYRSFEKIDVSSIKPNSFAGVQLAILADTPVSTRHAKVLADWVWAGGQLIAMAPSDALSDLLGLKALGKEIEGGYLTIGREQLEGDEPRMLQFHGTARLSELNGATALSTLRPNLSSSGGHPAITLNSVGPDGGRAASFAFDLAKSTVLTRQGNPDWIDEDRDGRPPTRSNDLFFGASVIDPAPDWVDPSLRWIPQADELISVFTKLIVQLTEAAPLPRLWYFPHGHRAVVVLTGDDHTSGEPEDALGHLSKFASPGCSVAEWECIGMTVYVWPESRISERAAIHFEPRGFEFSIHADTHCMAFSGESFGRALEQGLDAFSKKYPQIRKPATLRTHCVPWSGWLTGPIAGLEYGIRLDANYYFWPPDWVSDTPGHFTGSAMPMRFADLDGTVIDVYQLVTQMSDESGQTYPATLDKLLDRALGPEQHFGVFTINAHTDFPPTGLHQVVALTAAARNVPVVSARQLLEWLDSRERSSLTGTDWDERVVIFEVEADAEAAGLVGLMPAKKPPWTLKEISKDGSPLRFDTVNVKGVEYGMFYAESGRYQVRYGDPLVGDDKVGPAVLHLDPEPGSSSVDSSSSLKVVFDEPISEASVNATTFVLRDDTGRHIPADVRVRPESREVTLIPLEPLAKGVTHVASLNGGFKAPRILDPAGNPLGSTVVWSFDTANGVWPPSGRKSIALIAGFMLIVGIPALRGRRRTRTR